jgi:hypothetical protein
MGPVTFVLPVPAMTNCEAAMLIRFTVPKVTVPLLRLLVRVAAVPPWVVVPLKVMLFEPVTVTLEPAARETALDRESGEPLVF